MTMVEKYKVCLPKNSINSIDIHKTKYMLLIAGNKVNEYTTPE